MGEIADAMLDGTLCAGCGEYLGRDFGFPQYCGGCEDPLAPKQTGRKRRREPDGQSSLPRFSPYKIPPREGAVDCPYCAAHPKLNGLADHIKAKHPEKIKGAE